MLGQQKAELFLPPSDVVSFAPPPSAKAALHGAPLKTLDLVPLAAVIGTVGHRFEFVEPGGTDHLKPGRPLSQSIPVNLPANAGFFVMINGFNHAFVRGDTLTERPLGQIMAVAGINAAQRTLNCNVRLTDSNSDDPVHIIIDVVAVFFN